MNWNLNSPHVLCENTWAIMTQQLLSTSFLFLIEKRTVFRRRDCGSSVQLQASGWVLTDTLQPPLLEDELLISVVRRCLEHFVALYNLSLFIQDIILFYLNKHTQLWLYCWQLKPSHHVTNSLLDYHLALPLLPSCFLGGARVNLFGRDGGARDDILMIRLRTRGHGFSVSPPPEADAAYHLFHSQREHNTQNEHHAVLKTVNS